METVKSLILSACFIGIISAAAEMICPSEKAEGQVRLILGAFFIIITVSGFLKIDIDEIGESIEFSSAAETAVIGADEYYITAAEKNLSRTLSSCLGEKGIETKEVISDIDISENNSIYINEVTAWISSYSDRSSAETILKDLLGEEVKINIRTV